MQWLQWSFASCKTSGDNMDAELLILLFPPRDEGDDGDSVTIGGDIVTFGGEGVIW